MRNDTKKDISYRKKYTCYYMITLAIPLVILLFVNILIQNVVKRQVIASNNRTLKQFYHLMDEKLEYILDDALSLALNSKLDECAKLNQESIRTSYHIKVSTISLLNQYYASGAYEDVFVWFPYSNYVVSGRNPVTDSTSLEKYCSENYDYALMQDHIKQMAHGDALHPMFWQVGQGFGEEAFLGITICRFHANSRLQNHVVTLVVDRAFFSKDIGNGVLAENDHAMLFSQDSRLLFSYQDNTLETLPESCRNSGIYNIETNGERYTLLVQESKAMEGFYTMLISQKDFYEPLTKIRTISFAGIILSIFFGFLIVRKMIRNTYRPLEEILEKIESAVKRPFAGQKKNEFAFISEIIASQEEEQKNDRLQRQQAIDTAKKKHLLLAVLEGQDVNEADIEQLETQLGQDGSFLVVVLFLKDYGNVGWDLLPYIIDKEFSDCFDGLCLHEILSVTSTSYVIILQTDEKPRSPHCCWMPSKGESHF